ncbi:hypothetical protein Droror1_Dr00001145 [Drosera rotundifolia]
MMKVVTQDGANLVQDDISSYSALDEEGSFKIELSFEDASPVQEHPIIFESLSIVKNLDDRVFVTSEDKASESQNKVLLSTNSAEEIAKEVAELMLKAEISRFNFDQVPAEIKICLQHMFIIQLFTIRDRIFSNKGRMKQAKILEFRILKYDIELIRLLLYFISYFRILCLFELEFLYLRLDFII